MKWRRCPQLQVDGKFDYAHALAVLKAQGRSVPQIEELFRRDVKLQQLDKAHQLPRASRRRPRSSNSSRSRGSSASSHG